MDNKAVSPVGGMIIMVVITIVLAVIVFVVVNDLGSTEYCDEAINYWNNAADIHEAKGEYDEANNARTAADYYESKSRDGESCRGWHNERSAWQ